MVSSRANTSVNVSCEGIPLSKGRNLRNQGSLHSPNEATSTHELQSQIAPHNATNTISISGKLPPRFTRGSVTFSKCSSILPTKVADIGLPLLLASRNSLGLEKRPFL